jgi:hypothetical protein
VVRELIEVLNDNAVERARYSSFVDLGALGLKAGDGSHDLKKRGDFIKI